MAHIYYGNRDRFQENQDVADAVATLSDDFWALFEFDVAGCNIDCLMIAPASETTPPGQPSLFILTEIKHVAGRLRGFENAPWTITRAGIEEEYRVPNSRDDNPWQQTIRAVNTFKIWFSTNQLVILDRDQEYNDNEIRVWPTLLIVRTDSDDRHALPRTPSSRFGSFAFSIDEWLERTKRWKPNVGIQLTRADVERLVGSLNLTEWIAPAPAVVPVEALAEAPLEAGRPLTPGLPGLPGPAWAVELTRWASDLERRISALEATLAAGPPDRNGH